MIQCKKLVIFCVLDNVESIKLSPGDQFLSILQFENRNPDWKKHKLSLTLFDFQTGVVLGYFDKSIHMNPSYKNRKSRPFWRE